MSAEYQRLEAEASAVELQLRDLGMTVDLQSAANLAACEQQLADLGRKLASLRLGLALIRAANSSAWVPFPISAGLAPAGSQLVGYYERRALARSPSGSFRWRQRLVCYSCNSGPSRAVPAGERSSRCFHPGKPEWRASFNRLG